MEEEELGGDQLSLDRVAGGVTIDPLESNTHSFIVKVWHEATAGDTRRASWRGHITHVPSRGRRYLRDADGICFFVAPTWKQWACDWICTGGFGDG